MRKILGLLILAAFAGCGKGNSNNDNGNMAAGSQSTACLYNTSLCNNSIYNQYATYGFSAYPGSINNNGYYQPGYQQGYQQGMPTNFYGPQYGGAAGYGTPFNNGMNGNFPALCACPGNSRPVYNGSMGIGCVQYNYFWNLQTSAYYYSGGAYNNHYTNWPQYSNYQGGVGSNNGCYNDVAWSCLTDLPNSCPSGSTCQSTYSASRIGICVH